MAGFELGIGRAVAPALRLEAVLQHRPSFSFKGRANFVQTTARQSVSADLSSLSGMIAAYVDLPQLGLRKFGPFSPFIGAGAGVSRIEIGETRMEFPKTATIVPGGQRVGFARMLTAGVGIALTEAVIVDLAYRYNEFRRRRNRQSHGTDCLARWEPRTTGAQSRRDAGKAVGPWTLGIPALPVLNGISRQGACTLLKSAAWRRIFCLSACS